MNKAKIRYRSDLQVELKDGWLLSLQFIDSKGYIHGLGFCSLEDSKIILQGMKEYYDIFGILPENGDHFDGGLVTAKDIDFRIKKITVNFAD